MTSSPTGGAAPRRDGGQVGTQLESLFVQQVLKVLWDGSPMMKGAQADMYRPLFEGAMAEELARAANLGVSEALLGPDAPPAGGGVDPKPLRTVHTAPAAAAAGESPSAQHGEVGYGALGRVQKAAQQIIGESRAAWGKDGALGHHDLRALSDAAGKDANFVIDEVRGYQGYYKCNLFAFELAQRAGFDVPIVERSGGVGVPGSRHVTKDASDGSLDRGWAQVVTAQNPRALNRTLSAGKHGLMLAGSGGPSGSGHMAMVERIHEIERDESGSVSRIVFDGWEGRTRGAEYLQRRTWNRNDQNGGHLARNGFQQIEIIELQAPEQGPTSQAAGTQVMQEKP